MLIESAVISGPGQFMERTMGTPQGGVISAMLANLFLHYVFDHWMKVNHSASPFARYAGQMRARFC